MAPATATCGATPCGASPATGSPWARWRSWCWLRGGQTLAMKAWRIRLVGASPARALARFVLALVLVPTGISILWALLDADRQFLHDRIAGTRLVRA
jgi:uncharacterized RDD family membrane protein YckC